MGERHKIALDTGHQVEVIEYGDGDVGLVVRSDMPVAVPCCDMVLTEDGWRALISVVLQVIDQWQPIETAPQDGRDLLVLTASGPVVAHWRNESVTIIGARRGSRGHGLRSPEGWILNGVTRRTVIVDPTHWMPIPAPPTEGAE